MSDLIIRIEKHGSDGLRALLLERSMYTDYTEKVVAVTSGKPLYVMGVVGTWVGKTNYLENAEEIK